MHAGMQRGAGAREVIWLHVHAWSREAGDAGATYKVAGTTWRPTRSPGLQGRPDCMATSLLAGSFAWRPLRWLARLHGEYMACMARLHGDGEYMACMARLHGEYMACMARMSLVCLPYVAWIAWRPTRSPGLHGVLRSGGPYYAVPLGRRDGLTFSTINATLQNLPPPSANASTILSMLATKNLNPTDVVALSGGHTIGISHCTSFTDRLYPTQDPTMDQTFANNLKLICPTANSTNTTVLDIRTPNIFDNKYYVDLMNRQGLFTSDQDLYTDNRTRGIVTSFAIDQNLFFQKFAVAMTKMGQLSVLTGNDGEIRANCSARNAGNKSFLVSEVVEELPVEEARSGF
ncbi:Peroxidase 12 [Hibiscus syriacus]|uniref:Peroxidase n=1 Tax=Hibiscus syriacus TaxID=106335 RepID=A0A6A3BHS0_HIBSY|nr:Peroxidase 12 [Hibiscus syriacus]